MSELRKVLDDIVEDEDVAFDNALREGAENSARIADEMVMYGETRQTAEKPVAWRCKDEDYADSLSWFETEDHNVPLYAHPSNVHRLSDFDLENLICAHTNGSFWMHSEKIESFAKALMDACGIPQEGK